MTLDIVVAFNVDIFQIARNDSFFEPKTVNHFGEDGILKVRCTRVIVAAYDLRATLFKCAIKFVNGQSEACHRL